MHIAKKESGKMSRETKCPVCQKPLVLGQCPDCGYHSSDDDCISSARTYDDDHIHINLKSLSAESIGTSSEQTDAGSSEIDNLYRVFVILTWVIPVWGFVIGLVVLKSKNAPVQYTAKLKKHFIKAIVVYIILSVFTNGIIPAIIGSL